MYVHKKQQKAYKPLYKQNTSPICMFYFVNVYSVHLDVVNTVMTDGDGDRDNLTDL